MNKLERVNPTASRRPGPSRVIRIKCDTYDDLEKIAKNFENPDDVIRRLIKTFVFM